MSIAGNARLEAAQTSFNVLGTQIFEAAGAALSDVFIRRVPVDGKYLEVDAMGVTSAVAEIVGSRRWSGLRAYVNRAAVKRYGPDGIRISALDIEQDRTGLIGQRLGAYVRTNANFYEAPITAFLLTNPTGMDGVALLNASHPFGAAGAVWNNITTNPLSPAEFATGIQTMESLQLENGEPAGYYPDTLMVGPSNRKMAIDLTGADRLVPIANTGLEAYASVVAAGVKSNWIGETPMRVIVNPRFVGTNAAAWLLMDTKREEARPIIVGEAKAPMAVSIIQPESQGMADRAEARFYVEAWAALVGGVPFGIYGRVV